MPFAGYDDFDACVRANSDKRDPDAYCAAIKRQVEESAFTATEIRQAADEHKIRPECAVSLLSDGVLSKEDPCWEGYEMVGMKPDPNGSGEVPNCVPVDSEADLADRLEAKAVELGLRDAPVDSKLTAEVPMAEDAQVLYPSMDQAAAAAADFGLPPDTAHEHTLDGESWYMPGETHEAFIDAISGMSAAASTSSASAIGSKAEFSEGDAVSWSWQGDTVHGRVAEVRPEQATVSGNTITGGDDESVYVIDEYDDRVEAFRRENVAKPESSLDESQKNLPDRGEENYVSASAWDSLTTLVSESTFTPRELDYIARTEPAILEKSRPGEWTMWDDDPVVYRADIAEKYLAERDEDFFVPNEGAADAARKVKDWKDEYGDDVAGGASDGEGARRGTQLIEYAERGEPLAIEYWQEILNYHSRHRAQGSHELDADKQGEPWTDAGYVSDHNWGSDAGYEQAQRVVDLVEEVEQEMSVTLEGAVATGSRLSPDAITQEDSNRVDIEALEGELREAVEADSFYVYGKASIEQWDADDPPTYIKMDALEGALDRYFESTTAPGIISRHHQDIPVGRPVREFEFAEKTSLNIGGDTYTFEAGDVATSHVEDADGDGRPELWLAANIDGETEMGKKTRVLAAQGDLNGFSVTVHRNEDNMTQEGRVVTDCDLHAVTIGTDEQIKNKGSTFDVASFKGPVERVREVVRGLF